MKAKILRSSRWVSVLKDYFAHHVFLVIFDKQSLGFAYMLKVLSLLLTLQNISV